MTKPELGEANLESFAKIIGDALHETVVGESGVLGFVALEERFKLRPGRLEEVVDPTLVDGKGDAALGATELIAHVHRALDRYEGLVQSLQPAQFGEVRHIVAPGQDQGPVGRRHGGQAGRPLAARPGAV